MIFIADTGNGMATGKIWFNDDETQTSKIVNASDVYEICGDMGDDWDWNDLESLDQLNAELYGFSFTQEPEYTGK